MHHAFLVAAGERLDAMERALDAMHRHPDEVEHLQSFSSECHRLTGAAASYGLVAVSDAAAHAEAECDRFARAGESPDGEARHRWRELLREMRSHLAAAGAGVVTGQRMIRLLCVDDDPATEASLQLLDADSAFVVELSNQLPEGALPIY